MKKLFTFYSFLLIVLFLAAPSVQAATIRLSSPKVELELAPGETYSGEISAENPADEEIKTRIYLEDWAYSPGGTGEKKFMPMGSAPLSASRWITFSPAEDLIKPFGRTTVRYTITVPPDAKGGYYSVLFFETILGSTKDDEGVSVLVAGRIGALFFVQIKGTVEKTGTVEALEIKAPQGNKPVELITTFKNSGNVDITVAGNFLIMDSDGGVQGRGELNKIYTFPGTTEKGSTPWIGRLAKGNYQVLVTYDLGKGQSLVEEKTLTVA